MKKHSIWLPVLFAMMLGVTGCGDEGDNGGTGATGGSGTGATGGSNGGDFCTNVCNSPCIGDLGMGDDIQDCINGCETAGIFQGCESQTTAFIDCLEANDCGESGGAVCIDETLAFLDCFDLGI